MSRASKIRDKIADLQRELERLDNLPRDLYTNYEVLYAYELSKDIVPTLYLKDSDGNWLQYRQHDIVGYEFIFETSVKVLDPIHQIIWEVPSNEG